jgi:excisionase family DNA binding protein
MDASHTIPRKSIRIREVAKLFDCDEGQVRRLIKQGALEAHTVGKRGKRVYLDSVSAYQARGRVVSQSQTVADDGGAHKRARVHSNSVAHQLALAELRSRGILV